MHQLDEQTRERFTQELRRDSAMPFDDEFQRTTELERQILDNHGLAGAQFILRHNGFVAADDSTCPWQLAGLDAAAAVRQVLAPLRAHLPEFISALEQRIRWVIPARIEDRWVLVYVIDYALHDGTKYYQLIVGGAPNAAPRLPERAASLGWVVPQSLCTLYQVHDGLGAGGSGILACRHLVDLGEIMDPIALEQDFVPDGYRFQDLLEFRPDGVGNCQAFHRQHLDERDPLTVDWDHETREISGTTPFFEYADEELLSQVLDEE
jgi:hypothetical protein